MYEVNWTRWRSPNHEPRRADLPISMVILHSCEGAAWRERNTSLPWLCNPKSGVSCNLYVCRSGLIYGLVPEERRAWHAGRGSFAGITDLNSASIGIELEHRKGTGAYPQAQLLALRWLLRDIRSRRPEITIARMVSHRIVALPAGRKQDPTDWREPELRAWLERL